MNQTATVNAMQPIIL